METTFLFDPFSPVLGSVRMFGPCFLLVFLSLVHAVLVLFVVLVWAPPEVRHQGPAGCEPTSGSAASSLVRVHNDMLKRTTETKT